MSLRQLTNLLVVSMLSLAALTGAAHGCTPKQASADVGVQRAAAALTVEMYRRELAACLADGKDAGSMAVYSTCAAVVDQKFWASK